MVDVEVTNDIDISSEENDVVSDLSVSPKKTSLQRDDFVQAAGLQRTGSSGRKSSVEKMLELTLNTADKTHEPFRKHSSDNTHVNHATSSDSDDEPSLRRGGRKVTPEKPRNLKSDKFIEDAGLSRTGCKPRKSSMEKLLEDQLQTRDASEEIRSNPGDDVFLKREKQASPTTPTTTPTTTENNNNNNDNSNEQRRQSTGRKNSVYEQKNIEAPTAIKGNRITARTEHLFKQYERDVSIHEVKPVSNINNSDSIQTRKHSYTEALSSEEKTKVELVREEKERELREMKEQYQQRLMEEEQEQADERAQRNANAEVKSVQRLGDIKNRYLAIAKGEANVSDSDDEERNQGDPTVVKSGGKEKVVSSGDGVGNIRERFGSIGKAGWKKQNKDDNDTNNVDTSKVNSARNLFKNFEKSPNNSQEKNFVRPTVRKRDPKELMEERKKITYGGDGEELPQDGVVKKSVVLDDEELGKNGSSTRKEALETFEADSTEAEKEPIQKPTNQLMSDSEAIATMEVKKIEQSDVSPEEDVSGYETNTPETSTPTSPTSEASDAYSSLSDGKDDLIDEKVSQHVNDEQNEDEEVYL